MAVSSERMNVLREEGYTEIDLVLLQFVTRYAGTPVKWDIVAFFAENPFSRDVARNIAGRIGRRVNVVSRDLDDLVLLGLLRRRQLGDMIVYYLSDRPDVWDGLSRFQAAFRSESPHGRRG